jgi:hypothetical protein
MNKIEFYKKLFLTIAVSVLVSCSDTYLDVSDTVSVSTGYVNIGGNTVEIETFVESLNPEEIKERGVCWSTSKGPTVEDAKQAGSHKNGIETITMNDLTMLTDYYVRAYAEKRGEVWYSEELFFNSGYYLNLDLASGKVFYNDGKGHGLVAATDNQGQAYWAKEVNMSIAVGGTGTAVGTGSGNTDRIIAQNGTSGVDFAAGLARSVGPDWYLPSKDELNLMYRNIPPQGNLYYWSSSESGSGTAWYQYFPDGVQAKAYKHDLRWVRAVRAF